MGKALLLRYLILLAIILLAVFFFTHNDPIEEYQPAPPEQTLPSPPKTGPLPNEKQVEIKDIQFPDGFFFGSASSDFQTTGGNGLTDWDEYIKTQQGKIMEDKSVWIGPGNGTDFLNRYKEDFNAAEKIGIQVHRISLEWARIEPIEGEFDRDAIAKYVEIFTYMRSKNIEPMICLNHFTLPEWFSDIGGWESPKAAQYYSRYASIVANEIGLPLKIKWWLTFNEPQLVISIPYGKGTWPPFKKVNDYDDAEGTKRFLLVSSHIIDAHRLSYRNIHKVMGSKSKPMVGFASAPGSFSPNDPDSKPDQIAYNAYNTIHTLLMDFALGTVDRDFIGLNYYGHSPLKFHFTPRKYLTDGTPFEIEWIKPDPGERPKYFNPKAFYDLIMQFKDLGLPIVITENGLSDSGDKFKEEFIIIHLKVVQDAISNGANVIGYQYWALTDTWEWDGLFSHFGLISIDRKNNLERKLTNSALIYGEIIKTGKIKEDLLKKHKELLPITPPKAIIYDKSVENNICDSKEFKKGVVSLTFDDGWKEIYQNAIPILNRANIKSTQYINIYGPADDKNKFMAPEDMKNMAKSGHEIGSHAIHHKRFTELKEPEIKDEMERSKDLLEQMGAGSVDTFAYPYGEYTDYSVQLSRNSKHKAVRTTLPGMNDLKTDKFLLHGQQLENWMVFDPYLKRLVDRAAAENRWLIFIFHQIANPDYQFYTSPQDLKLLIEYLIENKVPVMTVRDVIKKCYVN